MWGKAAANVEYLVSSGLLFEINRTVLHPIGLAMTVVKNPDGSLAFGPIKDCRKEPHKLIFERAVYEKAQLKLNSFMRSYGDSQIDKRQKALGWGCQSYHVVRYKNAKDKTR